MDRITHPDQLIVGEAYWLRNLTRPGESKNMASTLREDPHGGMYFEKNVWATEENPQAFERWKIWGPIPRPDAMRGFTLVELLIVCFVVGLIAVVALPMLPVKQPRSITLRSDEWVCTKYKDVPATRVIGRIVTQTTYTECMEYKRTKN